MAYELSDSVTIAASPAEVFHLISDITRTGEWSAQCYRAEWNGNAVGSGHSGVAGAPAVGNGPYGGTGAPAIGSTFTGHNRTPEREWSTVSEVVASEPGVEFSWKVLSSGTLWGYRLEPVNRRDDATVLTEFTTFTSAGEEFFQQKYGEDAVSQEAQRREAATYGITETLQNIKALLED